MVDPFGTVPVTLMDGVNTDIAGTAFGPGLSSFTNAAVYRASLVERPPLPGVGCRVPQVVEVRALTLTAIDPPVLTLIDPPRY